MTNENNNPFANINTMKNNSVDEQTSALLNLFEEPKEKNSTNTESKEDTDNKDKKQEDEPVVQIKEESKTKNKTKQTTKKKNELSNKIKEQKNRLASLKVDKSWTIAYSAQQYNPPEDNMTIEAVREWLEIDYPELSKERCRIEISEDKKLIVPIVSGAKKG